MMFRRPPQKPAPAAAAAPPPRPAAGDRLYVVGDVHGRIDLLELMLRRILADFVIRAGDGRRPKVIFIGDILDRGDFARDVVRRLRALSGGAGPYGEVITLMGNHEAALLAFLDDPVRGAGWLRYGGMQTLASYGVRVTGSDPDRQTLLDLAVQLRIALGDDLEFLRQLPLAYRSGDILCVHAGVDPGNPDGRDEDYLLWGKAGVPESGPVAGLRVVHGHFDAPDPVVTAGRICVDTGAYHSGRLTAVRLDDGTGLLVASI